MTNEEIKAVKDADSTFAWMNIEHGFVSRINDMFVIAVTDDEAKSIATELLDFRARMIKAHQDYD